MDSFKLKDAAGDAIDEAIRWSTVGIVSGSGNYQWQGLGTGTLIQWNSRHLILTAAHAIADTSPSDLRFFLPSEEPPRRVERPALETLRGVSASLLQGFSELQIQGTVSNNSDDVDLAAIVVDEDLDGRHPSARFFELVPGGQAPTVGESVFAWGFPRDLLRTTSQQGTVAFIYGHWSEVSANGKEISTFNPDLHFAAPFVEESPQAHPMGLSGSVQWFRRPTPPPALWTTNLDVGGVTITYDNPSRLLKMVRREVVERFLSAHFS